MAKTGWRGEIGRGRGERKEEREYIPVSQIRGYHVA